MKRGPYLVAEFEVVEATPFVDGDGDDPAESEEADDEVAEGSKAGVEAEDGSEEAASEMELVGQESEGLDAADDESDDDGDEGDGEVVVELAHRLDEGPAVSAEHKDVVGGVNERHAGGEEDREDEDGAERKSA